MELGAGQHHWPPCFCHLGSPGCRERGEGGHHDHAASPPGPFTPCVTPGPPIPTPARVRLQPTARPPFPETQCQCPAHGSLLPQDGLVSPGGLAQSGSGQRRRPQPPGSPSAAPGASSSYAGVAGQGLSVAASLTASTLDSCLLPLPSRPPLTALEVKVPPHRAGFKQAAPLPRGSVAGNTTLLRVQKSQSPRRDQPGPAPPTPSPGELPTSASSRDVAGLGPPCCRWPQGASPGQASCVHPAASPSPWGRAAGVFALLKAGSRFPPTLLTGARLSLYTALTARPPVPGLSAEPGLTC